jgi:CheY-like chemotaxis protein
MKSLVVDDEFVALTKMVMLLGRYGQCDAATHGKQAINMFCEAYAKGVPYELVTLDLDLPGMTGLELLQVLNEKEQLRQMQPARKLVITANPSRTNVYQAMESRCGGFLVKPVSAEALAKALTQLGFTPPVQTPAQTSETPQQAEVETSPAG